MRFPSKLFKKVKDHFNNEEMLQLFLKYSEGEVSDQEQKKIEKWVHAYEDRQLMFENLKKTMQFHKKLSIANEADVKSILKELKEIFPNDFAEIPDSISPYLLLRVLRTSIGQLNWEMCWALANGNKWIRVLAFFIRVGIAILSIIIIWEILSKK